MNIKICIKFILLLVLIPMCIPKNFKAAGRNCPECVVLLHGLGRTNSSMQKIEKYLHDQGYTVVNTGYPSRTKRIEDLAMNCLPSVVEVCRKKGVCRINFITHSMGGILLRYYLKQQKISELGRVVMLSPPNQGCELVDRFRDRKFFKKLYGPAGQQLGTAGDSLPNTLGGVDFDLGVITGDRTLNPIASLLIPGKDDGKVSVQRAKVEGMRDFLVIHANHTFIMRQSQTVEQCVYYLINGRFKR